MALQNQLNKNKRKSNELKKERSSYNRHSRTSNSNGEKEPIPFIVEEEKEILRKFVCSQQTVPVC